MYLCASGFYFDSFYDFVLLVLQLFRHCGIICFPFYFSVLHQNVYLKDNFYIAFVCIRKHLNENRVCLPDYIPKEMTLINVLHFNSNAGIPTFTAPANSTKNVSDE